ncbi:hypothetical protein AAFF_G00346070 [Aldrovandia affinis]|uniref:Uncharacterized protein n=1 Tax=Aldrovandia affinis TaxID=143900 RepID=A0AAD7WPN1_9TELE|nr:hypothetical protein AAFF_G00346070 [Aldrovandia affinis]
MVLTSSRRSVSLLRMASTMGMSLSLVSSTLILISSRSSATTGSIFFFSSAISTWCLAIRSWTSGCSFSLYCAMCFCSTAFSAARLGSRSVFSASTSVMICSRMALVHTYARPHLVQLGRRRSRSISLQEPCLGTWEGRTGKAQASQGLYAVLKIQDGAAIIVSGAITTCYKWAVIVSECDNTDLRRTGWSAQEPQTS